MGLLKKAKHSLLTENKKSFFVKALDLKSKLPVTEKKKSSTVT